jgi:effector-binding domain-containing protein
MSPYHRLKRIRLRNGEGEGKGDMAYNVQLRHRPRRHLAVVKFECGVPDIGRNMSQAFSDVAEYLQNEGIEMQSPAIAYYEPAAPGFKISAGFPVAEPVKGNGRVVAAVLPESDVATTTHVGPYNQLPVAYEAIQAWMKANEREPADVGGGVMWEEYWTPPPAPPAQTRTDVYWPLKKVPSPV